MRLKKVDLPAPFGPITAAICWRSTVRLTADTAVKPPNVFVTLSTSSIAPASSSCVQPVQPEIQGADKPAREHEQQHHQYRPQHEWPVFGVGGDLLVEHDH